LNQAKNNGFQPASAPSVVRGAGATNRGKIHRLSGSARHAAPSRSSGRKAADLILAQAGKAKE